MPSRQSDRKQKLKVLFIIAAFLSLTALVVFKSGVVNPLFNRQQALDKSLLSSVALSGMVRLADLNFSPGEIKRINYAALKYKSVFDKFDFNLNYEGRVSNRKVEQETVLVMDILLKVDGGGEISSWSSRVEREHLVPTMVEYIDKAAGELERIQKLEKGKKSFKRIYI